MAHMDSDSINLSKRIEQVQRSEDQKIQLINELSARLQIALAERNRYQTVLAECNREQEWMHHWPAEKQFYENYIRDLQRTMTSKSANPFVLVLIDGDGMLFLEDFLRDGEQGGRQAALKFHTAIKDYIHAENDPHDVPFESRVVCQVFANVRGLANVLVRTCIIPDVGQFEDFVRGFNGAKRQFGFKDVGSGKDRADEEINESFKLFSEYPQCRRVLLGCSHDNGYARLLEEYADQEALRNKVILLEGVPFEKELVSLPYKTKKFPCVFRSTKLVAWGPGAVFSPSSQSSTAVGVIETKGTPNTTSTGLPIRFPAPTPTPQPSGSPLMDSPLPTRAMLGNLPRTPSTSTLASDSFPATKTVPAPMNYAAKAAMPPPPAAESPLYKPANRDEVIARNRLGQRVDPPCKDYDKTEVDRIKRIKLCNVHFLRNECPYADKCTHLHAYQATENELATLRLVARMAPCTHGSGCQDIKCIYGHRCPAPPGKNWGGKGTKSCIFGEMCKFAAELHDVDTTVVKTLVIR